jgi:hypothetical protein
MLAGHYTTAFVAKAASPATPLWTLLLAAQFVDVLWVLAILGGVEHARLDHSLASNPLDLYHMPFTHSLAGTLVWAAVAWVAARRALRLPAGAATLVAAVVTSHWFLDLVVHRPDLTIAGGQSRLGLALWNQPLAAYALEVVLVVASIALATAYCAASHASRRAWIGLGAGLVVLQTAASFGPAPASLTGIVLSTLVLYLLVAFAGARVDAVAANPR